jgi:hypothetical protein
MQGARLGCPSREVETRQAGEEVSKEDGQEINGLKSGYRLIANRVHTGFIRKQASYTAERWRAGMGLRLAFGNAATVGDLVDQPRCVGLAL